MVSVNLTSPVPSFNQYQTAPDQTAQDPMAAKRLELESAREQVSASVQAVKSTRDLGLIIGMGGSMVTMCLSPFIPLAFVAAPLGGIIGSAIFFSSNEILGNLRHQDAKLANQQKKLLNQVNQLA